MSDGSEKTIFVIVHTSPPATTQKMCFFFKRNVTRNRATIEVKNEKSKEEKKKKEKSKTNPKPWTLKVAPRPSSVLLATDFTVAV